MSQIVIDGLLTNYQIIGDGDKTVLILPGWRRSISEWLPVAKSLSYDHKIILLDLPGFDTTALSKETFGVFEYAEFVKKFLSKLKINNCSILGHSFGGRIGIVLAAEKGMIDKLILVDSAGIENKSLYAKFMRIVKIISSPIFVLMPLSLKNKIKNMVGSGDYKTSAHMRKIFVRIVNQNLRTLLPKIKIPTFIMWGDRDAALPVSQTKIFKKEIAGSKVRIVWGAGHDPHLQKTEQFIAILKEIL